MDAVSISKERKFYNGTRLITWLAVSSSIYRVFLVFESKISLICIYLCVISTDEFAGSILLFFMLLIDYTKTH